MRRASRAAKVAAALQRRAANDTVPDSPLRLPPELRSMILAYVFEDLPRYTKVQFAIETVPSSAHGRALGRLTLRNKGWVPPSILQTCHVFRIEGIPQFARLPTFHRITEYRYREFLQFKTWQEMVEGYYKFKLQFDIVLLVQDVGYPALARRNLEAWVKLCFYLRKGLREGTLPSDDTEALSHLSPSSIVLADPHHRLGRADDLIKVLLKAYELPTSGDRWEVARKNLEESVDRLCGLPVEGRRRWC